MSGYFRTKKKLVKKLINVLDSRLDTAKDYICELECLSIEYVYMYHRKKKLNENILSYL